jgi:hypothetical protein
MAGPNNFDALFGGGGLPATQGQPAPAMGGETPAAGPAQGGMSNPAARAVLERFIAFAKSQNWSIDEMVEFIMSVVVSQARQMGQQPPSEEQVRQLVTQLSGQGTQGAQPGGPPTPGAGPEGPPAAPQGGAGGMPLM